MKVKVIRRDTFDGMWYNTHLGEVFEVKPVVIDRRYGAVEYAGEVWYRVTKGPYVESKIRASCVVIEEDNMEFQPKSGMTFLTNNGEKGLFISVQEKVIALYADKKECITHIPHLIIIWVVY